MKTAKLLLLWLITAGWTDTESNQPRTDRATLIIYRQREFGASNYTLYVNDQRIASIGTNRSIKVEIKPGHTSVRGVRSYLTNAKKVYFETEAGKTYYVKAVEEIDFMAQELIFGRVSDEQAKQELRRIKPIEVKPNQNPD